MKGTIEFSIARNFSRTPGPRFKKEGKFSGEALLEDSLRSLFEKALAQGDQLIIDLDGTAGYATSFLEAVFGGLARDFGAATVRRVVRIRSAEEPYLKKEIAEYICAAEEEDELE